MTAVRNPFSLPKPSGSSTLQGTQPNYGQLGGQLAAQAVQYIPHQQNPYATDNMAWMRGAGAGFEAGSAFGPQGQAIGAAAGAILGSISDVFKTNNAIKGINTGVDSGGVDMYGAPQYNSSAFERAQQTLNELNNAQSKGPGVMSFTPTGLIGQGLRALTGQRGKRKDKIEQLQANLAAAQDRYNTGSVDYDKKQLAMAQYNDQQRNDYNFPYNLI